MSRRILTMGTLLVSIVLAGQGVQAKSLEDVLKEKGVITEEDYREIVKSNAAGPKQAASKPLDYKLGKGFIFTSADEKFQLTLGGRMQFRYTFLDYDDDKAKKDLSQWDAKRIRIILQGHAYSKDLTYKMEVDPRALASGTSYKGLVDAYMNYRIVDEAELRGGQHKVPFGRQNLVSDGALSFVDRSMVVEAFKPDYDMGASLNGKVAGGLIYYNLGVFGGDGQTTTRATNDNLFAARVAVNPFGDMRYDEPDFAISKNPLMSIGANYFRNTIQRTSATAYESVAPYAGSSGWLGKGIGFITTANNQKVDIDSYGADLAFKWMGLSIQGEYLAGQAQNQTTRKLLRAEGFYAQAGYMILPELEVAFRYSYLDPNRDVANDIQTEQIGALSYYFNKHNLKIQADVGNIHTQGGNATLKKASDDMQYRVQAQIIF